MGRMSQKEDIAIIGYGFDFPGGIDEDDKLWELLVSGRDVIKEIPEDRWDWKKIYDADPDAKGKSYSYHGGFLDNIRGFDPYAFKIMPKECENMDPQQRIVLKTAWKAMENSFLNIEQLKHSNTGVFIGATMDDYMQLQAHLDNGTHINRYTHMGSVLNTIAGRVSYVFGFHGPSLMIDTACSSSLVAIDSAIKAIMDGDCDLALAGGVNVILSEEMYLKFSRTQMLSKTGKCKTFSQDADGYVRGEGCGILVLQKLSEAKRQNKKILAVIKGSVTNHNGNSIGLTAPNGNAQEILINRCIRKAGINCQDIDYIEAHGTGTQLGDKLEIKALQQVFKGRTTPIMVGSIKTNLGHLESAAGIAGLIKVLLCMKRNQIVSTINLAEKNKGIDWDNSVVSVAEANTNWKTRVKIAGISSFGASGTNAHIILQQYTEGSKNSKATSNYPFVLAISAKSKKSLYYLLLKLYDHIILQPEGVLRKICEIYNTSRSHYVERKIIAGNTAEEFKLYFKEVLENYSLKQMKDITEGSTEIELQEGMIKESIRQYEAGRDVDWNFSNTSICNDVEQFPVYAFDEQDYWIKDQHCITDNVVQPKIFTEYIDSIRIDKEEDKFIWNLIVKDNTRLVNQHIINQDKILVGTFQLQLINEFTKYIGKDKYEIRDLIFLQKIEISKESRVRICINCVNNGYEGTVESLVDKDNKWVTNTSFQLAIVKAPVKDVIKVSDSGANIIRTAAPQELYTQLEESGLYLGDDYKIIDSISISDNKITAELITSKETQAILDGASQLLYLFHHKESRKLYLPYYLEKFSQNGNIDSVTHIEASLIDATESEIIANLLYYNGENLVAEYNGYHLKAVNRKIELSNVVGLCKKLPNGVELYTHTIKVVGTSLSDHAVYHKLTIPGAYYISQIMSIIENEKKSQSYAINNINFYNAVVLDETTKIDEIIQVEKNSGEWTVSVYSGLNNEEVYNHNAMMTVRNEEMKSDSTNSFRLKSNVKTYTKEMIIEVQRKIGLHLGETFHWMQEVWMDHGTLQARISNRKYNALVHNYIIPPGFIDTSVQALGLIKNIGQEQEGAYIPLSINQLKKYGDLDENMWCEAELIRESGKLIVGNIRFYDNTKQRKILEIKEMTLIKADQEKLGKIINKNNTMLFKEDWILCEQKEIEHENTVSHGIEFRFGINSNKIIVNTYDVEGDQLLLTDKSVIGLYDDDQIMDAIKGNTKVIGEKLIILSHSDVHTDIEGIDRRELDDHSYKLTEFYFKILKMIQTLNYTDIRIWAVTDPIISFNNFRSDDKKIIKTGYLASITWGIFRSIQREVTEYDFTIIGTDEKWLDNYNKILCCNDTGTKQLCIDAGESYTPHIVPANNQMNAGFLADVSKCYVVIGGLGALGTETCHMLLNNNVKNLLIIGKSESNNKKKQLEDLQKVNPECNIRYVSLDMASLEALSQLKEILADVKIPIASIIYAAGIVVDKFHTNYSESEIKSVYAAKIGATYILSKLIEEIEVDSCICYSSIVGVLGAEGQSVYGAANCFQDQLCSYMRSKGHNMYSIQWGPWGEVGMFTRIDKAGIARYEKRRIKTLTSEQAIEGLIAVTNIKFNTIVANMEIPDRKSAVTIAQKEVVNEIANNGNLSALDKVKHIIAVGIGADEMHLNDNKTLLDMGIDSLLMVEIRSKINKELGVNLPLEMFFNDITINTIVNEVERCLNEKEEMIFGEI